MKIAILKTPIWDMGFASPDLEAVWKKAEDSVDRRRSDCDDH
jgi:hypothetical protein